MSKRRADQAKAEKEGRFQQQRRRIYALRATAAAPVDQDGGGGCTEQKRYQRAQPRHHQSDFAQREVIGHGGHDARHVRGILPDSQKATSVRRTSDECQPATYASIVCISPLRTCKSAKIVDRHGK